LAASGNTVPHFWHLGFVLILILGIAFPPLWAFPMRLLPIHGGCSCPPSGTMEPTMDSAPWWQTGHWGACFPNRTWHTLHSYTLTNPSLSSGVNAIPMLSNLPFPEGFSENHGGLSGIQPSHIRLDSPSYRGRTSGSRCRPRTCCRPLHISRTRVSRKELSLPCLSRGSSRISS